jgi:GNAT superfamily N-acetyltransferase
MGSKMDHVMDEFVVKSLDPSTWPAYADLIERHNGIWGGCWCMGFQNDLKPSYASVAEKKEDKHSLICKGRAHAAVVFSGDIAIGWCQYGRSNEISPRNKFKKTYFQGLEAEPDWRITCFFVDRKFRGKKISSLALEGALRFIAEAGGGIVEAYPEDMTERTTNSAFICLGTIAMFERRGFVRLRQVAKHHWVMTRIVDASKSANANSI